ncbi:MAG: hypothetical protein EON58_12010 [Alphaproteobacteria bacterium]|nr:MAG: hypothetical protein EON58_12010 [Alphaproteobacteria bacterium]
MGIAIALTQVTPYWAVTNREILEEYCQANPGMPDARPLLCQAYVTGLHVGPIRTFLTPEATAPEEPQPARALEIAQAILKERPSDPLGRYFAGISQFMLHRQDLALIEFKAALASEELPSLFRRSARAFIVRPSFPALRQSYPY